MNHKGQTAVGRILFGWMLERGYMVDPDEGEGEIVADHVDTWDAQDFIDRLAADGFDLTARPGALEPPDPSA